MKPNLIIRASAGTGKTFSLATRFIRLMLFDGVDPRTIVALTFSRTAAKEIYTKLLERLWKAAMSEEGASAERDILLDGLSPADLAAVTHANIAFTPERFAELLRLTVDSQEAGAIATLDSFILRLVRSFPLEMGFQHAVEVLDDASEIRARHTVTSDLLSAEFSDDIERDSLLSTFRTAHNGAFIRTCRSAFSNVISSWHQFLLDHPEARGWTVDSMCAALGVSTDVAKPDVEELHGTEDRNDPIDAIAKWIREFDGGKDIFPKNKPGEVMRYLVANPNESVYRYFTEKGKEKVVDCGEKGAEIIREAFRRMVALLLRKQLEIVAAKLTLCKMFDESYDLSTRRRGQLTFTDFTHCQALSEGGENPIAMENIQYRFDERFNHWALDEFQDTSKLQWRCLKRLVEEAAYGEHRSVMVVGDLKQSIYGWRGGDDGPFKEVMSMPAFSGERGQSLKNDISYRYAANTVDFINRVFGPENLQNSPHLNGKCQRAVDDWLSEGCWMKHQSPVFGPSHPRAGERKDDDYVELIRVDKPSAADAEGEDVASGDDSADDAFKSSSTMRILAPKVCALVKDLWQRHESAAPGTRCNDTIGILVRGNDDGAYLAECIRSIPDMSIPVVWEGANGIMIYPAVQATLKLLWLAEHPEDKSAWVTVNRLFPARKLAFPELDSPEALSRKIGELLSQFGLSRTLRMIVTKLTAPSSGLSGRPVAALETLILMAVTFENRNGGGDSLDDFLEFLRVSSGRDSGDSPRVVRILTIHRAKGLTLDHVIVPIAESGKNDYSLLNPDSLSRLEGQGWALDMIKEELASTNESLYQAWQAKANDHFMEQLRLYYVALTRARKSTYAFVFRDPNKNSVYFADLLLAPFVGKDNAPEKVDRGYGEIVYSAGHQSFSYVEDSTNATAEANASDWVHRPGSSSLRRITPSAAGSALAVTHSVKSMAAFFSSDFEAAAKYGISVHEQYASKEWINPEAPADDLERQILESDFRSAFVKPSPEATVWRERAYEYYDAANNAWESGRFDRVVFTGDGPTRAAVIYDFKTNSPRPSENPDAFAARMSKFYAPQMSAYRQALNRLTGIPLDQISTRLLLESTHQSVP